MAKITSGSGLRNVRWGSRDGDGNFVELGRVETHIERFTVLGDDGPARTVSIEAPTITFTATFPIHLATDTNWDDLMAALRGTGYTIIEPAPQPSNAPSLGDKHSPITGREPALSRKHGNQP